MPRPLRPLTCPAIWITAPEKAAANSQMRVWLAGVGRWKVMAKVRLYLFSGTYHQSNSPVLSTILYCILYIVRVEVYLRRRDPRASSFKGFPVVGPVRICPARAASAPPGIYACR